MELVQSTIPGEADTGAQALQAAFAGRASNSAVITVKLAEDTDLEAGREQIKEDVEPVTADGFEVTVSEQDFTGAGGGLAIIVSGQDPVEIKAASDAIVAELETMKGIDNVDSDAVAEAPQVSVAVDPNKAAMIGSSTAQIGQHIRSVLVGQSIGSYALEDGTTAEAILRVSDAGVDSIEGLRQMPVSGTVGTQPLGVVADVEVVEVRGTVTRVDGSPAATVSADITSEDTGAVSVEAQQRIDALTAVGEIPEGVEITFAGSTAEMNEAFDGLFFSMGVAIPALLITDNPLGISAMIGFLMLIGIVVTNAIVLLDFVEQLRARGEPTQGALIKGANTRVRPILMTAVATILALMPVAIGFSHGSIIAEELATVVIGGLFTSTFLTLMVIPVLYLLVDGGKQGFQKRFMSGGSDEETPAETPPATPAPAEG